MFVFKITITTDCLQHQFWYFPTDTSCCCCCSASNCFNCIREDYSALRSMRWCWQNGCLPVCVCESDHIYYGTLPVSGHCNRTGDSLLKIVKVCKGVTAEGAGSELHSTAMSQISSNGNGIAEDGWKRTREKSTST